MHRSCAFKRGNTTKHKYFRFQGVTLKGKSTLMVYDRHPELQRKWDKAFWARGRFSCAIKNIDDTIKLLTKIRENLTLSEKHLNNVNKKA